MSRVGRAAGLVTLATLVVTGALAVRASWHREAVRRGAQVYQHGRGVDGPLQATVARDVPGTAALFPCVNCHLASGFGASEGQSWAPPITAGALFTPAATLYKGRALTDGSSRRPAYTSQTLARALREGVDPAGRPLQPGMPRYVISDADLADLVAYLETLSAEPSPGVTADGLVVATVVSDGASPEAVRAHLFALRKYVAMKHSQVARPGEPGVDARSARMSVVMAGSSFDSASRDLSLEVWRVSGPAERWPDQLEAALARRPVFAVLGGVVDGPWQPVHAFCERRHLPCLVPFTSQPAESAPSEWTLYATGGLTVEGAAAARALLRLDRPTLAVELTPSSAEGAAAQRGYASELTSKVEGSPLRRVPVDSLQAALQTLEGRQPGELAVLVTWDTPAAALEAVAQPPRAFDTIITSGTIAGLARPASENLTGRLQFAWPYRPPTEEMAEYNHILTPWLETNHSSIVDVPYQSACHALAAGQLFSLGLMELRGQYNQRSLVERISMLKDERLPCFERLSFGLGQSVLSKGARLLGLADGGWPEPVTPALTY